METPYISKIYKYIHIFREKIEFCSRFYVRSVVFEDPVHFSCLEYCTELFCFRVTEESLQP